MPNKPQSKRKLPPDTSAMPNQTKKAKTDAADHDGPITEPHSEVRGGLVILRAPSRTAVATANRPADPSSSSSSKRPAPDASSLLQTPSRRVKPRVGSRTPSSNDAQVADDVRAMDEEADFLRRNSLRHIPESSSTNEEPLALDFGAQPRSSTRTRDRSLPLRDAESPQIARNRKMRDAAMEKYQAQEEARAQETVATPVSPGHRRRRSSFSSRGKRISSSYEATGVIAQPHSSVKNEFLHKHIDHELPAALQLRQLLVWSWPRARAPSLDDPRHSHRFSQSAVLALKSIEDHVLRKIADKMIATSSSSLGLGGEKAALKPNPKNVENEAWKAAWKVCLDKLKGEDKSWGDISSYYTELPKHLARGSSSTGPMQPHPSPHNPSRTVYTDASEDSSGPSTSRDTRLVDVHPRPSSSRATSLPPPLPPSLPILDTPSSGLPTDWPWRVGSTCSLAHSANEIIKTMSVELDRHYTVISNSLWARYQDSTSNSVGKDEDHFIGWILSQYLPLVEDAARFSGLAPLVPGRAFSLATGKESSGSSKPARLDPQDLLQVLTSLDSSRQPEQVSDAARKAIREVRRVEDSGSLFASERHLTHTGYSNFAANVAGNAGAGALSGAMMTPKKVFAVPRRSSTAGRDFHGTPRGRQTSTT